MLTNDSKFSAIYHLVSSMCHPNEWRVIRLKPTPRLSPLTQVLKGCFWLGLISAALRWCNVLGTWKKQLWFMSLWCSFCVFFFAVVTVIKKRGWWNLAIVLVKIVKNEQSAMEHLACHVTFQYDIIFMNLRFLIGSNLKNDVNRVVCKPLILSFQC